MAADTAAVIHVCGCAGSYVSDKDMLRIQWLIPHCIIYRLFSTILHMQTQDRMYHSWMDERFLVAPACVLLIQGLVTSFCRCPSFLAEKSVPESWDVSSYFCCGFSPFRMFHTDFSCRKFAASFSSSNVSKVSEISFTRCTENLHINWPAMRILNKVHVNLFLRLYPINFNRGSQNPQCSGCCCVLCLHCKIHNCRFQIHIEYIFFSTTLCTKICREKSS